MTGKIRKPTATGMTKTEKSRISTAREEPEFRELYQSDEVVNTCGENGTPRHAPVSPRLLRVLIVDDYRDSADSLAMLVKLWGHIAHVAYDGETVLDMIAVDQPDVLLLDIAMPGMDGFQLAQQLRREEKFKDTLLIAMTGYADQEHRFRWEGAFDHYLIKPIEPSTLENLLILEQDRLEKLPEASPLPVQKHGILVVDDEGFIRNVLEMALKQQGFNVWLAADGGQALDMYQNHRATIDVVLLDVRMPGLDGPRTLTALQEINPQVCCCFMSGELDDYTPEGLRALGAASLFLKPFRLDEVFSVLRELASRADQSSYIINN